MLKSNSQDYHNNSPFSCRLLLFCLASVTMLDSWPKENWVIIGFILQFLLHHLGKSRCRTQSMTLVEKTSPNTQYLFTFRLTFNGNSFVPQAGLCKNGIISSGLSPSTSIHCQQNAQNTCPQVNPMEVIFQIWFSFSFMLSWQTRFCHQST